MTKQEKHESTRPKPQTEEFDERGSWSEYNKVPPVEKPASGSTDTGDAGQTGSGGG